MRRNAVKYCIPYWILIESDFCAEQDKPTPLVDKASKEDKRYMQRLLTARKRLYDVVVPKGIARLCVQMTKEIQVEGHRGDYVMALAAQAFLRG